MRRRFAGFGDILVCTLTWASISPIVRTLDVRPTMIVLFRVGVGAVVVLGFAALRGRLYELKPRGSVRLLVATGFVLAVHWAMLFETYQRLAVAPAVALTFVGPVLAAAVAPRFLGRRLDPRSLVPVGVAFAGLLLITVPESETLDPAGIAFGAGAALTFAALIVLGKLVSRTETFLAVTAWQFGVASVPMLAVISAGTEGVAKDWPVLVLLGAVHTGFAGLLYFRAVAILEPHELGTMFYVEPAAAVVYAWIFLGERPTALVAVGFCLVVFAGLLLVRGRIGEPPLALTSSETPPRRGGNDR